MRYQGNVVTFLNAFGFIFCEQLNRRVFFHRANLLGKDPKVGDRLEFVLGPSKKSGAPEAAYEITPVTAISAGVAAFGGSQ